MSKGRVSSKATVSTKATGHRNNIILQASLLAVEGILLRIIRID